MINTDKDLRGHGALLAANVIFGLNMIASKNVLSLDSVSPYALNLFRIAGAAALFWLTSLFMPREKVLFRDLGLIFIASLFGVQFNQLLFLGGLSMTSSLDASIIATAVPVMTMIISALYLKEPVTWKKGVGVALGASGALMIILTTAHGPVRSASMLGNTLCLLSGMLLSCYFVFFKKLIQRYTPVTFMKWMYLFAVVCCTPFCWRDVSEVDFAALVTFDYLQIGYVVAFATFIAYIFLPAGQKLLRPTIVSMYNYVQPLVAAAATVVLGTGAFGWRKTLAAALIFTGVWLVTRSKSRAMVEAEKMEN